MDKLTSVEMTVEEELKGFSDHELAQMIRDLESEMDKLTSPNATYAAIFIMLNAICEELKSRRPDFQLNPKSQTEIDRVLRGIK